MPLFSPWEYSHGVLVHAFVYYTVVLALALPVLSLSGAVHPSSLGLVLKPCLTCRWSYRSLELWGAVLATRNHVVGAIVRFAAQLCFYQVCSLVAGDVVL